MELFINQLLSSAATILVMLLLPFFWWLVTARKAQKFFPWIGLMHGVMFFAAVGVLRAILITHK